MKKNIKKVTVGTQSGVSRRTFCKTIVGFSLGTAWNTQALFAATENVPVEPGSLDEPTPWQEGDPKPVESKIPAMEPKQTSTEAPPCQPMDDERSGQPGSSYVWVTGYWWWTNRTYVWVPGYWALPPYKAYYYVSGYWRYIGGSWVYIRGGWAKPNTTAIVVYPSPRPLLVAFVITAPIRVLRRHRRWRYYPTRRAHHRAVRRKVNRKVNRKENRKVNRRDDRRNDRPLKPKRRK